MFKKKRNRKTKKFTQPLLYKHKATYFTPISFLHRLRTLKFFGDLFGYKIRKEKLSNSSLHTYIKRPKSKQRKKSQWVRKDSWVGRIIIFGVIMFTISKGFAVISATKNLQLPFIEDICIRAHKIFGMGGFGKSDPLQSNMPLLNQLMIREYKKLKRHALRLNLHIPKD
ncbi:uncharacterized protein LOC110761878 [Prunus avium]|uniref:Uncharacterized protein LOC110761878 n=1 Tax=Prunus avium TaxID=42229 RepID=A0A6P5T0Q3_PRUAV|nr:uncharacterized protein LOC110761878 [Prunus avium]